MGTKMGKIDIDNMSLQELKVLQKDVAKAIDTFEDRQRQEARTVLEAKAREMGFQLNDLVEPGRKPGRKVTAAKYRHPENPELTWSGRGRQPQWIKDLIEAGGDKEDYRI